MLAQLRYKKFFAANLGKVINNKFKIRKSYIIYQEQSVLKFTDTKKQ